MNLIDFCFLVDRAWLPTDEKLLRVEAGVSALQPMTLDDDTMVGFEPPSLTSLRCDMFTKIGELDDPSRPFRNAGEITESISSSPPSVSQSNDDSGSATAKDSDNGSETKPTTKTVKKTSTKSPAAKSSSSDPRDALRL